MSTRKPRRFTLTNLVLDLLTEDQIAAEQFYQRHKQALPRGAASGDISSTLSYLSGKKSSGVRRKELHPERNLKRKSYVYYIPGKKRTQPECSSDPLDRLLEAVGEIEQELISLRQIKKLAQSIN